MWWGEGIKVSLDLSCSRSLSLAPSRSHALLVHTQKCNPVVVCSQSLLLSCTRILVRVLSRFNPCACARSLPPPLFLSVYAMYFKSWATALIFPSFFSAVSTILTCMHANMQTYKHTRMHTYYIHTYIQTRIQTDRQTDTCTYEQPVNMRAPNTHAHIHTFMQAMPDDNTHTIMYDDV